MGRIKVNHTFKCDECSSKLDDKEQLDVHIEKHVVKCEKCPLTFLDKGEAEEHFDISHGHKCEHCGISS